MSNIPWSLLSEKEPWETTCRRRRKRVRKPTLASVAKQVTKAGLEAAKYEFDGGKIVAVIGKPDSGAAVTDLAAKYAHEWN